MTQADAHTLMSRLLGGYRVTQMLYVAASLGLADRLARGPAPIERLARETDTNCDALYRLMRSLATVGVFAEQPDRHFTTTVLADTLRADAPNSVRPLALSYGAPWWWRSFGELLHCVRTGETGFGRTHGAALFDYLNEHPEAASVFNENMSAMTRAEAEAVVDAYNFDDIRLLVDVGGGHGVLATAILKRWPTVSAILFDQPSVIASAGSGTAGELPSNRCTYVGGDFFSAVPSGGDVYILKDILHDWDDERAATILSVCRNAMRPRGRLLVIERIVPIDDAPSDAKDVDITMLVLTGGRERTRAEYDRLLRSSGFAIRDVVGLRTGGAIMEAAASET